MKFMDTPSPFPISSCLFNNSSTFLKIFSNFSLKTAIVHYNKTNNINKFITNLIILKINEK